MFFDKLKTYLQECNQKMTVKIQETSKAMQEKATLTAAALRVKSKLLMGKAKIQLCRLLYALNVKLQEILLKIKHVVDYQWQRLVGKYQQFKQIWDANHSFTFFFVPANGQNVAKTHIKRSQIKWAFNTTLALVVLLVGSFTYMAHVTIQSKAQQKELAEYKQTKAEQERTIKQLRAMAEKNQKQLAALSKLEDQVRDHMAKNGAQLPPKKEDETSMGQGGPISSNAPTQMMVVYEQEQNIQSRAKATQTNLKNLLDVIEFENERKDAIPSFWPTSDTYVTSSFGGRRNPFGGGRDWHPGIDIAGDYGDPVYASGNGEVTMAEWYSGYGNYIKIEHGYGYETAYGHLSRILVRPGQQVKKGQLIGRVGSTGYSTGPHLHFEVMLNGEQVNPSKLM